MFMILIYYTFFVKTTDMFKIKQTVDKSFKVSDLILLKNIGRLYVN